MHKDFTVAPFACNVILKLSVRLKVPEAPLERWLGTLSHSERHALGGARDPTTYRTVLIFLFSATICLAMSFRGNGPGALSPGRRCWYKVDLGRSPCLKPWAAWVAAIDSSSKYSIPSLNIRYRIPAARLATNARVSKDPPPIVW